MRFKSLPPVDYLRQRFDYDAETGVLRWKPKTDSKRGWNRYKANTPCNRPNHLGYFVIRLDYQALMVHRIAWKIHYGEDPVGALDHINHDVTDNRIANLRAASHTDNLQNMSMSKANTSGVTGVSWYKAGNKWCAWIWHEAKRVWLGYFDDFDDAVAARKAAEIKYGFHPNHGKPREPA